ncbi:MAG: alpha/beta hydrolase family protein [Oceanococcus sp.]
MVRALFRSIASPAPAETPSLFAKVFYPGIYTGSDLEKNTGSLPLIPGENRFPLAILMPGINVTPEAYSWLAIALAEAGFVTAVYGWIVEEMPGMVALSPGLDISALAPDDYAQRPSATGLSAVIAELRAMDQSGLLAGRLDLDNIVLGGHSAGGSVALFNARPDWFPGLKAAFAYGSHSKASTMLGYPAETVLPLPDALPTLIMGGSEDGVIAASAFRYGEDGEQNPDPIGPLKRSFDEGLSSQREDCHLAIVNGANHFSMCWPQDSSTGRPFLDWPETRSNTDVRQDITDLVTQFAKAYVAQDVSALQQLSSTLSDTSRISQRARR